MDCEKNSGQKKPSGWQLDHLLQRRWRWLPPPRSILSGEGSCRLGSQLSLHAQTSCQWSPTTTGAAGGLTDLQLRGGACNWPGSGGCVVQPTVVCSWVTLHHLRWGQQDLPGRPQTAVMVHISSRSPWWHHIQSAPTFLPSPEPGVTYAVVVWQLFQPSLPPHFSPTDISPITVLASFTHLVSASQRIQTNNTTSTSPYFLTILWGLQRRSHLHMIVLRLREFHR